MIYMVVICSYFILTYFIDMHNITQQVDSLDKLNIIYYKKGCILKTFGVLEEDFISNTVNYFPTGEAKVQKKIKECQGEESKFL